MKHRPRTFAALLACAPALYATRASAQDAGAPDASASDDAAIPAHARDALDASADGATTDATASSEPQTQSANVAHQGADAATLAQPTQSSEPSAVTPVEQSPRPRSRAQARPRPSAPRRDVEAEPEQGTTVIGSLARTLEQTPGSVTLVRNEDLRAQRPTHAGEALRNVPGLHIVPEDGLGMRLNISVRGLDPNRSRKILILEDGIPVSLNPYGSPELYYTPPIERMDRIEVVRGSGQILYGPQTVGGVINYISAEPPRTLFALANVRGGDQGYFVAHAAGGLTQGAIGARLDVLHRRFNGPRLPGAEVTNVTARLRARFSPRSTLNAKFDFYDERSSATYVGPTASQFAVNPAFNPAIHDRFLVRRYAISLWHDWNLGGGFRLRTTAYGYETHRAWRRQNFERADSMADYERICDAMARCGPRGSTQIQPDNDGGSLFFRRDASIRDRHFLVGGIEPRLTFNWTRGAVFSGELVAVVRAHYEAANEQLLLTSTPTGEYGEPLDAEVRNGYAFSAAAQHRFSFWRRLHVTPGVRVETFLSDRRITRVPSATMPTQGADANVIGNAFSWALIPGLGVTFDATRQLTAYAGFHRGYSPPRTKDSVSNNGLNLQLDPELSWNFELGGRVRLNRWLDVDAAAFWIEFDNQIIPPSESGGAVSAGGFNTGHSRHVGVEASVQFDVAPLVLPSTVKLPLSLSYTWLPVADLIGGLWNGNRVPYAPEHMLSAQLRFVHSSGILVQVNSNLVSRQFTDRDNTVAQSRNALIGEVPTYVTLDARLAYAWRQTGLTFAVAGRNLTDQVYVASRAPQGIQAAGYRQVFAELEWRWPRM